MRDLKYMLKRGGITFGLGLSLLVSPTAQAEEARLSRLTESYLIENLEREGVWSAEVLGDSIRYVCQTCGGKAEAWIEVLWLRDGVEYPAFAAEYLQKRRTICADLAVGGFGRCVKTAAADVRFPILRGFISETVKAGGRETEIVFFYNQGGIGPELIRAEIFAEDGAKLPPDTLDLFMIHVRRLTVAW